MDLPFKKKKVKVGKLIKVTPGKRHGWFESEYGPIRKPLKREYVR